MSKYSDKQLKHMAEFVLDCLERGADQIKGVMLIAHLRGATGWSQETIMARLRYYADMNVTA